MNPGDIIGHRYRIIRSLGEGGMANVYLAHDLVLDRDVSVKLLRLDLRTIRIPNGVFTVKHWRQPS